MQQTRKTELWVGSFVLAGICAILVMIFQVADVKALALVILTPSKPSSIILAA